MRWWHIEWRLKTCYDRLASLYHRTRKNVKWLLAYSRKELVGREHGDVRGYADKVTVSEVKDFSSQAPEQLVISYRRPTDLTLVLRVRVVCSSLSSSKVLPSSTTMIYEWQARRWSWMSGWLACPSEIPQGQIGVVVPSPWQTSPGCFDRSMCVERVEPRGSIILRDQISLSNKLLGVFVIHCGEYLKRVFYRKKEQACNKCQWVNPCRDWIRSASQEILSASILNETRSLQDCLRVCQMMM